MWLMLEKLEQRRLFSGGGEGIENGTVQITDANPGFDFMLSNQGRVSEMHTVTFKGNAGDWVGWTVMYDEGGTMLVNNNTGQKYQLPTVKSDGSVNLTGTSGVDQITVERVTGVESADLGLKHFIRLSDETSKNVTMMMALPTIETMQKAVIREKGILAEREAQLAEAQKRDDPARVEMATNMVEVSKKLITSMSTMVTKLTDGTQYIRYRLAGVYEFYVEVSDEMTAQSKIRIDAGGGSDNVSISGNVPMKTVVSGGAGADKLSSGSKRTSLCGGGGNDQLISRSKQGGTLDGGKGADKYYNRFGEVQILARKDGDCVVVNGATTVAIGKPGTLGVTVNPTKCYFMTEGDKGQTDLLA